MRTRARSGLVLAALAATTAALAGCETTAEKSAQLEKAAKRVAVAHVGLSIARASRHARATAATVVHDAEGAAAAVTVRNLSSRMLTSVPIAITVRSAHGQTLYQNNAAGLEAALTQVASIPPHGAVTWVDDQVPSAGEPASVGAVVGEAPAAGRPEPQIEVRGAHLAEASTGEAAGTVQNRSNVVQHKLVVYVTARKAGRIVAAGRAVLAEVGAGASAPFTLFLVGSPAGATLSASAPATTFG